METGGALEALQGKTVIDLMVIEPGKAVLLVADGDAYPAPADPPVIHLLYTEDLKSFTELLSGPVSSWPTAVAFWRGGLYVGLDTGEVLRSVP